MRSISPPLLLKRGHGFEEGLLILRGYPVLDRDKNRAAIGRSIAARDRSRPMKRRRHIDVRACLEFPSPQKWHCEYQGCGGNQMRARKPKPGSGLTPHRAA